MRVGQRVGTGAGGGAYPRKPGRRVALAAAAVILAATAGTAAGATMCPNDAERESLDVRELQTTLMVAALTCRARPDYNAFVEKYRGSLFVHGQRMRGYFKRVYGKRSFEHINSYVTELANGVSALSVADRDAFCEETAALFGHLLAPETAGLDVSWFSAASTQQVRREPLGSCSALTER